MDIDKIFDLIEKAEKSSFDKIEIEIQDTKIRLERNRVSAAPAPAVAVSEAPQAQPTLPVAQSAPVQSQKEADDDVILAPISGVFYVAKEPGAEPFVSEGSKVAKGEPICIIEAMKIMNEICAPKAGVIESVLVGDGQAIKASDALFKYAKEG